MTSKARGENKAAPAPSDGGNEFPKMVYGSKGKTKVVNSADEQADLGHGWSEDPSEHHVEAVK